MTARFMPEGSHTITPNIIADNAAPLVKFLKDAFGAQENVRLTMPDGRLAHCELQIGDSRINIGESMEGWPSHPLLAQIFVEDSDAVFARAMGAGATQSMPMTDMFFGSREGRVRDPFGNVWTISTFKEQLSTAEMQRRLDEYASQGQG
ncbi:MAG: hypothetical protein RLZZ450_6786 [Pseudomonadota bacterium]